MYDVPTGRLSKLSQDSLSTAEYQKMFEDLATKAHRLSRDALKEMYITGLNSSLQEKLLLARPKDLNEAFSLANMCEEVCGRKSTYQSKWTTGDSKSYVPPHKRAENVISVIPNVRKQLIDEEKKVRREKYLCFNCDEKWFKDHNCKGTLLLLSADGNQPFEFNYSYEDSSEDDECHQELPRFSESTVVSLNALDGVIDPKTIKLQGLIGDKRVSILVDLGPP